MTRVGDNTVLFVMTILVLAVSSLAEESGKGAVIVVDSITNNDPACLGAQPVKWEVLSEDKTSFEDYSNTCAEQDAGSPLKIAPGKAYQPPNGLRCASTKIPDYYTGPHTAKVSWCTGSYRFEYGCALQCDTANKRASCGAWTSANTKEYCEKCGEKESSVTDLCRNGQNTKLTTLSEGSDRCFGVGKCGAVCGYDGCDRDVSCITCDKGSRCAVKNYGSTYFCKPDASCNRADQAGCGAVCGGIDISGIGKINAEKCHPYERCVDNKCQETSDCIGIKLELGDERGGNDQEDNDGIVWITLTTYNYDRNDGEVRCEVYFGDGNSFTTGLLGFYIPGERREITIHHAYLKGSYAVNAECKYVSDLADCNRDGRAIIEDSITVVSEEQVCKKIKESLGSNTLDVVVIGDGLEGQEFENAVTTGYDELLSVEPFKNYSDRFNIYRIDNKIPLNCVFSGGRSISCDNNQIERIAALCPHDQIIVIADTGKDAASIDDGAAQIHIDISALESIAHEFGHSFGGLEDEYVEPGQTIWRNGPNCDNKKGCPKWKDITDGCFPGCSQNDWYRPTDNSCLMKAAGQPFCPVCYNHLEELLKKYKDG